MSRIANRADRLAGHMAQGSPVGQLLPADDDSDDWDEMEPDPDAPEIWDPLELEDDEEAEPEPGDFWPDRDDFEDGLI